MDHSESICLSERSPSFPPVGYDARCCDASAKQISAPKIIHSHCTRKGTITIYIFFSGLNHIHSCIKVIVGHFQAKRMDVVWGETAGVDGQLLLLCPILFTLQVTILLILPQ